MVKHNNVTIQGAFGLNRLTGFDANIMPNMHARAVIEGFSVGIDDIKKWQKSESEQEVTVSAGQAAIFCGLVESVSWEPVSEGIFKVRMQLVSGSTALDREKESMSFQDTSLSYVNIAEKAISSTPGACCICTAGNKKKPGRPMIQYAETDWEFAKRLASMVNAVLYPEVCRHGAYIWFGIPECGKETCDITAEEYGHGISRRFYERGGIAAGLRRRDFEYYKVGCNENINLGANVRYAGGIWRVLEKHIKLKQEEFCFTYIFGREAFASAKRSYNPMFVGQSIHGTVIKTGGDAVRLHLKIDEKQDETTAYPYQWVPDTGSVMYCMPEKGTAVSLYFPDEDERHAIAVNCIRQNGATCSSMSDTSKRALTTTEGKRMYLEPGVIGLDIKDSGHILSLEDTKNIAFKSGTSLSVWALKGIGLSAQKITIKTPSALNMSRNPESQ